MPLHCTSSHVWPECYSTADPYGDYQVGSVWGQWRQNSTPHCHRDMLFTAAQSAALAPSKEMPNLISSSWLTSTSPPGAVAALLPSISPLPPAADLGLGCLHTWPHTPCSAGRCPLTSHLAGCQSAGVEFIPIVAETLGGLAKDTIHVIRSFGRPLLRGLAHKIPLPAPNICSTVLLLPCGGGIPPFGCIAFQPSPPTVDGLL